MGRPATLNGEGRSITAQAALRLVFSLGLLMLVVALSAVAIYRSAIDKASNERANDLRDFYQSRLSQLEREWELQARDFRVRIEFTRLLERPERAALDLQAFLTIQGSDRRFQYLLIEDGDGDRSFHFGKWTAPERLSSSLHEGSSYLFDNERRQIYRVFKEPIWLGGEGMGRIWIFFAIDHSLLGQLASPGVTLTASYRGEAVASSLGSRGLEPASEGEDTQQRSIPWGRDPADPVQLTIRAPVKALFSSAELATAAGGIPLLDGLILWFTLGTWLMRQTRRINALEQAVRRSTGESDGTEGMERKLREAGAGLQDEISAVAETIRRTSAQRDEAERHIVTLNDDLKRRNQQLEAVNRELESFIYSVSHDLRAPLRSIAGYSAMLMEDYGERIDADGQRYLQRIGAGAGRMNQRIDDLLYLSLISRQEMERREIDLGAMATSVVAELREATPERQVEVVIESPLTAFADPRLMGVALSNLLANAWKFTQKSPAPRIEFLALEGEGGRRFVIRDNGAGFDQGFAERMFLPFHRLHPDTEYEGTGLGLAIVDRVIRRHGGRVWAEGAVAKGAAIYFTL